MAPSYTIWHELFFLVLMSALFSGLTLGLMGLDKLSLQVLVESGNPKQKQAANKIMPIRRHGNLLLCTLLLGNVAVNAALSIFMADLAGGLTGFLTSTAVIVFFGEIAPQSLCSRYALTIGAATAPIVQFLIYLMYIIAKPISVVLDRILGHEVVQKYSKDELKELVSIQMQEHQVLNTTENTILKGVLDFAQRTVGDVMTPLDAVFCIDIDAKLDFKTLAIMFKTGHSRIPVYDGDKNNLVAVLITKDLILINPEDRIPVRTIIKCYPSGIYKTFDDTKLDEMMSLFKTWRSHIAIVTRVNDSGPGDPFYENVGIVTLEDVIEELIQDEIVDETDVYVDNMSLKPTSRNGDRFLTIINMFDRRSRRGAQALSQEEARAILAFLSSCVEHFSPSIVSEVRLRALIARSSVEEMGEQMDMKVEDLPALFTRGEPADFAVLILHGRVMVESGSENFQSVLGPFSTLALRALKEDFVADFTARPITALRYICIRKKDYHRCLHGSLDMDNMLVPFPLKKRGSKKGSKSKTTKKQVVEDSRVTISSPLKKQSSAEDLDQPLISHNSSSS